jgi:hypothetical protein
MGDLYYGELVPYLAGDAPMGTPTRYFILDTAADNLEEFDDAKSWRDRLTERGVDAATARWRR